jgi:molybdopterin synthase catalytic subunit
LFSIAKDLAGFGEETIELAPSAIASDVLEYLAGKDPRFHEWRGALRVAVNQQYVHDAHTLSDGDEVAVIPPVSGG